MLTMIFPVSGTINGIKTDVDMAFKTFGGNNSAPYVPCDPYPKNGSTGVDTIVNLSWTGGDPDSNDTVIYKIYFGDETNPPLVELSGPFPANVTKFSYLTYPLDYNTTYYWKITAQDNHGALALGPLWSFTTREAIGAVPDLNAEGKLNWTDVEPGFTVEGKITVENIGDPKSLLDWEITKWPDWGNWTFTPSSGEDLMPEDGKITVEVSVVAPKEKEKNFTGHIKIINKENSSDYCIIPVSLVTPKRSQSTLFIYILEKLMGSFPLLEQLFSFTSDFKLL